MDDVDLTDKIVNLVARRTAPYPKCSHCGMFGVPGTKGKCPFCGNGEMR